VLFSKYAIKKAGLAGIRQGRILMYQQSQHLITQRAGADRRCGLDRRVAYDLGYFVRGGFERRSYSEKRKFSEHRADWVLTSPWSSVSKH